MTQFKNSAACDSDDNVIMLNSRPYGGGHDNESDDRRTTLLNDFNDNENSENKLENYNSNSIATTMAINLKTAAMI